MGGRAKLTVETSNEIYLPPAAYVQNTGTASIEAGGNAFFPADDGLDVQRKARGCLFICRI
jgi:hypothetical protein